MEKEQLFTIGDMANACGITKRTLRHYEEQGLIKPQNTDLKTGYRYYGAIDIIRITLILTLRETGMPVSDIADYFLEKKTANDSIERLKAQQEAIVHAINILQSYNVKKGELNVSEVMLPERFCIRKKFVAKDIKMLGEQYHSYLIECAQNGIRFSLKAHNYCEYGEDAFCEDGLVLKNIPFTMYVCVDENHVHPDAVIIPECKVVRVDFHGPYTELYKPYEALYAYIEQRGLTPCGDAQEHYLEGLNAGRKESDFITSVMIPVE